MEDKPSKLCPIGLECLIKERGHPCKLEDGGYCSNHSYCSSMASPWPLPYQIWQIDYYYDLGALIVSIPSPTNWEEVPNNEWDIQAADAYDSWINYIRRELREAGWENPVELPYYWDEAQRCLMVTEVHILEAGSCKDPEEGFAPAVKLDNWRRDFNREVPPDRFDQWGFYRYDIAGLAWAYEEEEDEDD